MEAPSRTSDQVLTSTLKMDVREKAHQGLVEIVATSSRRTKPYKQMILRLMDRKYRMAIRGNGAVFVYTTPSDQK
jgi:hypothetical protein